MEIDNTFKTHPFLFLLVIINGFFTVPILSYIIGFQEGLSDSNFTGLVSQPSKLPLFLIWFIPTFLILTTLLYLFFKSFAITSLPFFPFPLLTLFSALFPYTNGPSFLAFLHVFLAYAAFLYLHLLLKLCPLPQDTPHKFLLPIYLLSLSICLVLSVYWASITFLVEVVYLSSLS
ncbi:MAG: hypothetical protein ACK5LZ_01900, partial [Anaerorhabdus sp.]